MHLISTLSTTQHSLSYPGSFYISAIHSQPQRHLFNSWPRRTLFQHQASASTLTSISFHSLSILSHTILLLLPLLMISPIPLLFYFFSLGVQESHLVSEAWFGICYIRHSLTERCWLAAYPYHSKPVSKPCGQFVSQAFVHL